MHENSRYVKLAWIGLVSALALPAPARAEIVSHTTGPGLLAVAGDGSPRVAFLSNRDVVVARRTAAGWTVARAGRATSRNPVLAGRGAGPRPPSIARRRDVHERRDRLGPQGRRRLGRPISLRQHLRVARRTRGCSRERPEPLVRVE